MVNPLVNISGSSTRSVVPASGARTAAKCARLAAASCQASGCWTMLSAKAHDWSVLRLLPAVYALMRRAASISVSSRLATHSRTIRMFAGGSR